MFVGANVAVECAHLHEWVSFLTVIGLFYEDWNLANLDLAAQVHCKM